MPQILSNKTDRGYTVISDGGVVAFQATRQQAFDAIKERFPDAPEIDIDQRPDPGEWRTLHSQAIFAEMRSINNDLGRRDVAAETITQRIAVCEAMQKDLGDELAKVSRQQRLHETEAAQRAYDDALTKMIVGMWREMDECESLEEATAMYGLGCRQNLNSTPVGIRLAEARRRVDG